MSDVLNLQPNGTRVLAFSGGRSFAAQLIHWWQQHGRHDLPWQSRDPYRVWLSEIMLQQTQVATVQTYYLRFLQRFPDLQSLAAGSLDEVLALWSGLGYYTRARNLHACARQLVEQGGRFPQSARELACLPGIGPSTAAAIAAFCFGERAAILDGNVRRVLCRFFAIDGDPGSSQLRQRLQQLAGGLLPGPEEGPAGQLMPAYTQAMMDLGATVCRPRAPDCERCPLRSRCCAYGLGRVTDYPNRSARPPVKLMHLWLLHVRRADGSVLLVRRPRRGIWAGLYCLPAFDTRRAAEQAVGGLALRWQAPTEHLLTHRRLRLHCATLMWSGKNLPHGLSGDWLGPGQWSEIGLPKPISDHLLGSD